GPPPTPDLARVEAASRSLSAQPGVLQARQHSCLLQRGQTTLNALIWEPLRAGAAGQGGHERSPNRVRKAGSGPGRSQTRWVAARWSEKATETVPGAATRRPRC